MSKKIEVLTPIIMKLIHEGHSYSEIAEDLGLKNEKVIRNLSNQSSERKFFT